MDEDADLIGIILANVDEDTDEDTDIQIHVDYPVADVDIRYSPNMKL